MSRRRLKALFICASPLQLRSAIDAVEAFNFEHSDFRVIVLLKEGDWQRISHFLCTAENGWPQWTIDFYPAGRSRVHKRFQVLKMICLSARCGAIERVFIGDFRAVWMQCVVLLRAQREVIVLDDGLATVGCYDKFWRKGIFLPPSASLRLLTWFLFTFSFRFRRFYRRHLQSGPRFFTKYLPPESPNIVVDDVVRAGSFVCTKVSGSALFIGSKLSETGILSEEAEINFLRNIIHHIKGSSEIFYLAHRGEVKEKLRRVERLGFSVLQSSIDAEFFIEKLEFNPMYVAGFFSTVLFNVKLSHPNTNVVSFRIPNVFFDNDLEEYYASIYQRLSHIGVEVRELT